MSNDKKFVKGRGAQIQTKNPFLKDELGQFEEEGIDESINPNRKTERRFEHPKKIVNRVDSPDLGFEYSLNPYQGCEHGCAYCYARNTHHYWGYGAGLDFEQKIIVKNGAAKILEKQLMNPRWKVRTIMLSGNTDCYQPMERKLKITRGLLDTLLKFKHPTGIITKNDLVLRDLDILTNLASQNLIRVYISMNSLTEPVRRKLEPRTSTYKSRLLAIEQLSNAGIPVGVMVAPVIPGLTSSEIPKVLKAASEAGALTASYSILRLNGAVEEIFSDWLRKQFPGRAAKILNQVAACHGGQVNDNRFGLRMKGEGRIAESIKQMFAVYKNRYFKENTWPELNKNLFSSDFSGQLNLF